MPLDALPPLTSPALVREAAARLAALDSAAPAKAVHRSLAAITNKPATLATPRPPCDPVPGLLKVGHVANLRRQWEARIGPTPTVNKVAEAPPAEPSAPSMQTYRQPPLPPASVFALRATGEDTAPAAAVPLLPSPALLQTMTEHRSRHADAFLWRPLLLAGMPYAPRHNELHPYGIQARLSGEAMGADEPPVTGHTPQVFVKRAQLGEFLQLLSLHARLSRDTSSASPTYQPRSTW